MFKGININLSDPICGCDELNISWYILTTGASIGLGLRCKTCNTELQIPHSKFEATFILDKPYPGKQRRNPELKIVNFKDSDKE